MAALENTLKMADWKFLSLVIFLVPLCHCKTSNLNKTGLLFDQLDNLLVKTAQGHVAWYSNRRMCLKSSHALQENYRLDQKGIILLQNVVERYSLLTQLYNSGCRKKEHGNLSGKNSICEPFGCHIIGIRSDALFPKDSNIRLRTQNININHINITLNLNITSQNLTVIPTENSTKNPTEKSTVKPTENPTENPKENPTENPTEDEDPTENPKRNGSFWDYIRKWVPLPFRPWGANALPALGN